MTSAGRGECQTVCVGAQRLDGDERENQRFTSRLAHLRHGRTREVSLLRTVARTAASELSGIDWVIVGEDPALARPGNRLGGDRRAQCEAASVAFFFLVLGRA